MPIIVGKSGRAYLGASNKAIGRVPAAVSVTYAIALAVLAPASMVVGTAYSISVAPVGGSWNGQTVTPAPFGLNGAFSPPSAVGSGTAPIVFSFTPSAASSGTINATASPSLTSGGAQNVTVNPAAVAGAFLLQSVSGVPSTAVALNPFQFVLVYSGLPIVYMVLYANGADDSGRQGFGGGESPLLAAQNIAGGNYTVRLYDALTGGNVVWESSVITVSANPYRVGGTTTVNWPAADIFRTSTTLGSNAFAHDGYLVASGTMTDGGVWLSPSNTIPPDQPAGTDGGHHLGMLDFGGGGRPYQLYLDYVTTGLRGSMYLWAIVVSKADGTTSRLLAPYPPMTVS